LRPQGQGVDAHAVLLGWTTRAHSVYTEYCDPRTEWIVKIQAALKRAKLKLLVKLCEGKLSRREIIELRAARSKPHCKTQELFDSILKRLGFL